MRENQDFSQAFIPQLEIRLENKVIMEIRGLFSRR